jgi:hypothetical protein
VVKNKLFCYLQCKKNSLWILVVADRSLIAISKG